MAPSLKQALLLSMIVSLSVLDVLAHKPATGEMAINATLSLNNRHTIASNSVSTSTDMDPPTVDLDQGNVVKSDKLIVWTFILPDLKNLKELQNFFRKIDSDGDGEIAQDEANNVRIPPRKTPLSDHFLHGNDDIRQHCRSRIHHCNDRHG